MFRASVLVKNSPHGRAIGRRSSLTASRGIRSVRVAVWSAHFNCPPAMFPQLVFHEPHSFYQSKNTSRVHGQRACVILQPVSGRVE
jgi:hypothetical protein